MLTADAAGIAQAAALLDQGALIAFPTETVYGLGADARNGAAVARIFAAKDRPQFNPLIVHVADANAAQIYAEWSDMADRLAAAFWPGPLTLVLPLRAGSGLSPLVSAGQPSVALRAPDHPVGAALLAAFGGPIAAPSANPSGRISPTQAAHVLAGLDGRIAGIVDGGACPVGVESTIVGLGDMPTLLRPGGLPAEAVEAALGMPLAAPVSGAPLTAPGQLASHYAPRAGVRLNAQRAQAGEVLVGFGPDVVGDTTLSASGDLTEAAARLFEVLHALDASGVTGIAVAPIPDHGLGRAINDRLRRAAAPRGAPSSGQ
ncbi:threonylcarbamoyl-AMP synthase [Pseudohalocynthiibacter aestuariivivens]|uniref:Threonylcarbamoyl-AMP synthase n=1 Tax=Roseovarius pelagicus TaxID=2980108 RepID=A0ABY6DGM2_9RHOB|nr:MULTISPECIES: L-threonylcarbamoyladenylate synthase [Rhodobacterales]QIE47513.1 threonylcarbamoyl-AMP synthase [Pseudohalocynthiibacter aestuariivivens]UXX85180.1 L-threonylcarbamoyladenylate synthase [Roseovarius pelagicus]